MFVAMYKFQGHTRLANGMGGVFSTSAACQKFCDSMNKELPAPCATRMTEYSVVECTKNEDGFHPIGDY